MTKTVAVENNIRAFRKAAGLSQASFAESLCIDPSTVSTWENSRSVPDSFKVRIAALFGVSVYALFRFDEAVINLLHEQRRTTGASS